MNVYSSAHELASAIKASNEFMDYDKPVSYTHLPGKADSVQLEELGLAVVTKHEQN